MRPRLLDLFCGAGGAAMGYHRAGFDVVGVDIKPQPNYPFEFWQRDALMFVKSDFRDIGQFDAIHASPPCQAFTAYRRKGHGVGDGYGDLITETRELLNETGLPWVIENVEGAPLRSPLMLCGSMFDPPLDVQRHRYFETDWPADDPSWSCRHGLWAPRFPAATNREPMSRRTVEVGVWRIPLETQKRAMGIDWMTLEELSEAIPPAYTTFIGEQLLSWLHVSGRLHDGSSPERIPDNDAYLGHRTGSSQSTDAPADSASSGHSIPGGSEQTALSSLPLARDEQAWALAWGLIGACVQKRREARAAVSSPERKPE